MTSPLLKGSVLKRNVMGGESSLDADYIQFNITYADGQAEGRLQWNSEDGTLEVGMPGGTVNLQIGQEMLVRCRNNTVSTIANGAVVYISGTHGSAYPEITLAQANANNTVQVVGLATEEILSNAFGFVTLFGLVRGVNTLGFTEGEPIYLSETVAGGYQQNRPTTDAGYAVEVGHVLKASATEGVILCHINAYSPTELTGTTGWAHARWWDGVDYGWTTAPNFEGPVGINTSAPDSSGLHIIANGSADSPTPNGATFPLNIQKDDNVVLGIFTPTSYEARIQFGQITSGSGRMARIAVPTATGDMYFETGGSTQNFHMDTAGAFAMKERATAPAGLGAGWGEVWVDDAAPNVLWYTDDASTDVQVSMTTGTFTPKLQDSSFSDAEGQTYATQDGKYWLVGNLCFFWIDLEVTSLGTLTTSDPAYIAGLPFNPTAGYNNMGCQFHHGSSLNMSISDNPVGRLLQSTDRMILQLWDATTGTSSMLISEVSAGGRLIGNGWYRVQ